MVDHTLEPDGPTLSLVEPEWLLERKDDPEICLIEINRTGVYHYQSGHIPGAFGWYWKEKLWDDTIRDFPSPVDFARRLGAAGISRTTKVVFYGEPVQFGTYAWWAFRYCGHRETYLLNGGHHAWRRRKLPLVAEDPPARPRVAYVPVERIEEMRALRGEVFNAIPKPEICILDVRSPEEYEGRALGTPEANHGAERYGRIPSAVHRHFDDFLDEEERFKAQSELRALLDSSGAPCDKQIIVYCRLSHRASLAYFVLTQILKYKDVKLYDGSWTEWGSMVGMPIERPLRLGRI